MRLGRALYVTLAVVGLASHGCSQGEVGGGGPDSGFGVGPTAPFETLRSVRLEASEPVPSPDGSGEVQVAYRVVGSFADGHTEDITTSATFRHQPVVGRMAGAVLILPAGFAGKVTVTATVNAAGVIDAEAELLVPVRRQFEDPGSSLPEDAAQKFTGPNDPTKAPELVYPNDGVLLPPNLNRLEFHFRTRPGTELYQLVFSNALTDVKLHLRCKRPADVPDGCIYETDPAVWRAIAEVNRGGEPLTVTLRATDDAGAGVGTSNALTLSFSNDNLGGALYYWNTTTKAIMRFDLASTTQTQAELFVNASVIGTSSVDCIGCHALSRDGTKMVVEAQGPTDGRIAIVDVARAALLQGSSFPSAAKSFFASWNPDSTRFVGVSDRADSAGAPINYNLRIQDGTTGAVVETIRNTGTDQRSATHPDWSADGRTIAFTQASRTATRGASITWPIHGSIHMVTKNGSGWNPAVEIAPQVALRNRYYPAIAPNGRFLVFDESTCDDDPDANDDKECDGDTDPSAKLYAAALAPRAALIPLTQANAPGKEDGANIQLANSYPKWNPFASQRNGDPSEQLNWMTFSSTRKYGLRSPKGGGTLIWMAGVTPNRVSLGQDPSYPAFALPFQDLNTSNHIAQWTEKAMP
ncbi:MAG TPA: hypothetical protein VEY30_07705 [Myxococcaceae bacterium]|nr:hypothetical protein [Myxococcaceae bacterium]